MKTYQKILTIILAIPLVPMLSAIVGIVTSVRFFFEMWEIILKFGAEEPVKDLLEEDDIWTRHIKRTQNQDDKNE